MSLADWQKNSWLVEHETSPEEIAGLLAIVERDLANATLAGLADDWKLNIAYNAALQAATAALAAVGFAPPVSSITTARSRASPSPSSGQPPQSRDSIASGKSATLAATKPPDLFPSGKRARCTSLQPAFERTFSPGCGKITQSCCTDKPCTRRLTFSITVQYQKGHSIFSAHLSGHKRHRTPTAHARNPPSTPPGCRLP